MELQQRGRQDERANFRDPARAHEQRGQTEHDAIERREIRCAMSGAIADQDLMLDQKRLCGNGANAIWSEQLRQGDQQANGEDEECAHVVNATIIACTRKTAPHRRIPAYY